MIMYNETWKFEELNRSFGESYNAVLNHLHLGPILGYAYAAGNKTAATNVQSDFLMEVRETLRAALQKSVITQRPASVLLASIADKFTIEDALSLNQNTTGQSLKRIGDSITTIIYYDGFSVTVGKKTYVYPGVTPGKIYGIFPKRFFRSLVKHDLKIDFDNADISRLIEKQVVGRCRLGVYADLARSVEEITLPTS
jgi:hypothetical protein